MNPLLADPPAVPTSEQPPNAAPPQAGEEAASPNGALKLPPQPTRSCKSCGATLADGQEWCLQCGAGTPGSLAKEADWRPLAAIAAAGAVLLTGAGTAAYAALNQHPHKLPPHVLVAQVPAPTTPTPTTPGGSTLNTPPSTTTPTTPGLGSSGVLGAHGSSRLGLPSSTVRPPKLPAVVPTPRTSGSVLRPTHTGATPLIPTQPTATTNTKPATSGGESAPTKPDPILLDTDAASTYNPSGYPTSAFGDPGLTIDGETRTAWTAQVDAAAAPSMAEGLALDLKTARKLGSLEVLTTTPGMTVEVYGANGHTLAAAITDPAWTKLSSTRVLKKRTATIKLHTGGSSFRFIVLWLTKAPAGKAGKAGHVSLNELVLFPPAK